VAQHLGFIALGRRQAGVQQVKAVAALLGLNQRPFILD
jgi:hypothetical protein